MQAEPRGEFEEIAEIRIDTIKDKLGEEFTKKHDFTIYWGLKCGLFKEDYYADSYNKKDNTIKIRRKRFDDPSKNKRLNFYMQI